MNKKNSGGDNMGILGMYKNGNYNVMVMHDGTKIRKNDLDFFEPAFSESCDVKITNYCDAGCPYCYARSTRSGKHGDILNAKFVDTLHPYTEIALGGGSTTSHPDLIPFLRKLKERKIIANITVSQMHFMKDIKLIEFLIGENLVKGIGVSVTRVTDQFIQTVKRYDNIVIHVINGVVDEETMERLADNDLKLLVLGYKTVGFGEKYHEINQREMLNNLLFSYTQLKSYLNRFKVVSFDNLALKQLEVKRFLTDKEWGEFYCGDDGDHTFYIDLVEKKFSKNSLEAKTYDLLDDAVEMFNIVRNEEV